MDSASILRASDPRLLRELTRPWAPERGASIVCAVSGGADSVALACLLAGLAPGRGWSLILATVEHGQRGNAGRDDARSVVELAGRLGAPVRVVEADLGPGASEAEARKARHHSLAGLARERGAAAVALAHTMDDQAETLLHRLARGTGPAGAGAMARRRGSRWRPLLRVRRAELRALLRELGVAWREDETNLAPTTTRNRIRHLALPALERALQREVAPSLARAAELLRRDEDLLGRLAEEALEGIVLERGAEGVECDLPKLAALPSALRARVFRRLLAETTWLGGELTRAHLEALERLVTGGGGTHVDLPGDCAADRRGRRLILSPIPAPPEGR